MMSSEIDAVDTLYEICDAEFNSRKDIHDSFERAAGLKSWARYYLLHEVKKIAKRDGIMCSEYLAHRVAGAIAEMWFERQDK